MNDVVITGLGVISPAGRGVAATWEGLLAGKAAASLQPDLTDAGAPVTLACRVPPFGPDAELGRGSSRRLDRFTHLALLAAAEALADAGLTMPVDSDPFGDGLAEVDADRVGLLLGVGLGGAESWQAEYPTYLQKGPRRVSPMFVPKMLSNTAAGMIAIRTSARGPNLTVNTACSAGASAIGTAPALVDIQRGPTARGKDVPCRSRPAPDQDPGVVGHAHVTTTMTYDTVITGVDEAADLLPELH